MIEPPVAVGNLHLDAEMPALGAKPFNGARLLARLHTQPIGEVVVPAGCSPEQLAAAAWHQIGDQIRAHLSADGLPEPAGLPAHGLDRAPAPACLREQRAAQYAGQPISVVIATRDRTDSLLRCLASLEALDYPHFDVIVVDSAPSTDHTARVLADAPRWRFDITYVRADRPGLALAHNTALPAVTGEVVAFTDDDVEVDRHWLTAIAARFAHPGIACITGLIMPAELRTRAQLLVEESGGFARGFAARTYSLTEPAGGPLFPFAAGRFGSGANMAFRTAWLRASGGFDAATGAGTPARGGDDLRAFLRVVLDGRRLAYEPAAVVRHWHRRDYAALRRQAFGYGVGLGAYLAATVADQPSVLGPMLRRTAPALRHLLAASSPKNVGKSTQFPASLTWRERAGVLAGPFAYAASRRRYRDAETGCVA